MSIERFEVGTLAESEDCDDTYACTNGHPDAQIRPECLLLQRNSTSIFGLHILEKCNIVHALVLLHENISIQLVDNLVIDLTAFLWPVQVVAFLSLKS